MKMLPTVPSNATLEELIQWAMAFSREVANTLSSVSVSELTTYSIIPIGSVVAFVGDTAPTDWALCNGALFSKTEYAGAYEVIGDKYTEVGDPSDSFRVPDFEGKYLYGETIDELLGTTVGNEVIKLTQAQLPDITLSLPDLSHTHTLTDPEHSHTITDPGHSHVGGVGGFINATNAGVASAYNTSSAVALAATGITVDKAAAGITVDLVALNNLTVPLGGAGADIEIKPLAGVVKWIVKLK